MILYCSSNAISFNIFPSFSVDRAPCISQSERVLKFITNAKSTQCKSLYGDGSSHKFIYIHSLILSHMQTIFNILTASRCHSCHPCPASSVSWSRKLGPGNQEIFTLQLVNNMTYIPGHAGKLDLRWCWDLIIVNFHPIKFWSYLAKYVDKKSHSSFWSKRIGFFTKFLENFLSQNPILDRFVWPAHIVGLG